MSACVYLVGAGPGAEGLITVRGLELIERADAVVFDYLANSELLAHAPASAELIDVGKKGFAPHMGQEAINQLLVDKARELPEGSVLVRLKGGDPFVFGRGGEEALALAKAGIAFEVVPGVTSGVAAAAYAGIPVTHRGLASSVSFITGHEDPQKNESALDWAALAALSQKGGTLCFYMGMRNLALISERLQEHGASAQTPAALIRWGTLASQQSLVSTLGQVAEDARQRSFGAPAIILVGPVARLHDELTWFERKPLFGARIVVTRSRSQASELSSKLAGLGAQVLEVPTITFAEPESFEKLDAALGKLDSYDWLVFTSVNGVDAFFARLDGDARLLAGLKVAAIGPATATRLREHGICADVVPEEYRGEAVAKAMEAAARRGGEGLSGARVLLARAQVARDALPRLLEQAGARVDVAPAYRTLAPDSASVAGLEEELRSGAVDAITFTSSSTVTNLLAMLGSSAGLLANTRLFAIGPITAQTLRDAGFEAVEEASEYTIAGLVDALIQGLGEDKEH